VTIDELALEIQRALQNRDATSDRRQLPDMHTVIVRVLSEFVEEHERNVDELEARIEELNKH
jgi:hypothetical protein